MTEPLPLPTYLRYNKLYLSSTSITLYVLRRKRNIKKLASACLGSKYQLSSFSLCDTAKLICSVQAVRSTKSSLDGLHSSALLHSMNDSDLNTAADSASSQTYNSGGGERLFAQQACNECRRRKGRCDRVSPECSTCVKYNRHCLYAQDIKSPLTRK